MLTGFPNADQITDTLVKVTIDDDNGNTITFGNYGEYARIYTVSLRGGADSPSWGCDRLEFRNQQELGPSLDPLDTDSDFNDGTIAHQLLDEKHSVKIEFSKDDGTTWVEMYKGEIGKITSRRSVEQDDVITVSPNPYDQPLKERMVRGNDNFQPLIYTEIDLFDLIDQVLSDQGFSLSLDRTNSDDPSFAIALDKIRDVNTWTAINNAVEKVGYKLLFRNVGVGTGIKFIVFDPARGNVAGRRWKSDDDSWAPDATFNGGWDTREAEVSAEDVRTAVMVQYKDDEANQTRHVEITGDKTYGARDYGGDKLHRWMILDEDDKSHIDTEIEATNMATLSLDDLSVPEPDMYYTLPYCRPDIQRFDILRFGGDGTYTTDIGVTEVVLEVDYERQIGTTSVRGAADRVIASRDFWLNHGSLIDDAVDAFRGDMKPPEQPEKPDLLAKIKYGKDGTPHYRVLARVQAGGENDVIGYQWRHRLVETDDSGIITNRDPWEYSGFTPNPTQVVKDLPVNDNYRLQVEAKVEDWENSKSRGH